MRQLYTIALRLSLKPIGRTVAKIETYSEDESGTRPTKASRARVLDRFSAERAQRVRVGDLWTRFVAKQVASYVAVAAYAQSFPALRKKSAQLGLHTVATTVKLVVLKP